MARTLLTYRSYSFKNKDPVIDQIRTIIDKEGVERSQVSLLSNVTTATLKNWFDGDVRMPRFATIAAVAGGLGCKVNFTKDGRFNFDRAVTAAEKDASNKKTRAQKREAKLKIAAAAVRPDIKRSKRKA